MLAAGASAGEIAAIRAADRAAQGVSDADEAEAIRAIAARRQQGALTIVETRSTTSSAIADRMLAELGGPGYQRLLVVMPGKVGVFADGPAIVQLAKAYPKAWWGGALPQAGFWGTHVQTDDRNAITDLVSRLR
jgi:hypothetical protein